MDFINTILYPIKWLVSAILWVFHQGFTVIGLPSGSGWTWALSIVGLVLVIRAALIPVFVRQIRAMRGMQAVQPDLKKIQEKYKGKKDQLSRQAMAQEMQEVYKKHGTNPFSSCLPMLIQAPFFYSLYLVLSGVSTAKNAEQGIGMLSADQIREFDSATIFGAPLSSAFLPSLQNGTLTPSIAVLTISMILLMIATQFITQRQIVAKNVSEEVKSSPFYRQQQMMIYVLPLAFGVGGIFFPIGVLIYWTTTNLWTMGQQYYVIRHMPTPGTPAYAAYLERRKAKGLPLETDKKKNSSETEEEEEKPRGQRVQPQRKNRRKRS